MAGEKSSTSPNSRGKSIDKADEEIKKTTEVNNNTENNNNNNNNNNNDSDIIPHNNNNNNNNTSNVVESTSNSIKVTIYTEEEKKLLETQLKKQKHDDAAYWNQTELPLLSSMVEKVLQLATDNYDEANNNSNDTNNNNNNNNNNTATPTNQISKSGNMNNTQIPSKMDRFLEENIYILEQLRLQPWPFFTLPRLWEILADPFKYNINSVGKLRGEKLQAAIRRCILVSTPLLTLSTPDF